MMQRHRCLHRPIALAVSAVFVTAVEADAQASRYRVVWHEDPTTHATIGWDQGSGENPVVYYDSVDHGQDVPAYRFSAEPSRRELYQGMDSRFSRLEELEPDTSVYFVIADSEGVSRRMWFKTAPDKPEPFTFVAGGDTKSYGTSYETGRVGNALVSKVRPLFVLYCGDFVSGSKNIETEWQQWLDDWAMDTVSPDGRIYPIIPVRGNHEQNEEILYRLFALPDTSNYFALTIGGDMLRIYVLNSEINIVKGQKSSRSQDSEALRAQTSWLRTDLQAHEGVRFKAAAYHKPIRAHTAKKRDNDYLYPWAEEFYAHGVSLALEGDSHMHKITWPVRPEETDAAGMGFVRDDARGTMYVGEGSWGAARRANDDDKSWTMLSASIQQIKWVHVRPTHIEIRTLSYTLDTDPEEVEAVDDAHPLRIPRGLTLYSDAKYGEVIRYPPESRKT